MLQKSRYLLSKLNYSSKPTSTIKSILFGDRKKAAEFQETYSKAMAKGTCIHELSIHNLKPESTNDYRELVKEFYPLVNNSHLDARLFGTWSTMVGNVDQIINIWEYSNYDGYQATLKELRRNGDYFRYLEKLRPMLISRENQIILEFQFCQKVGPNDYDAIYELRSYKLKPGRMLAWEEGWETGLRARRELISPIGAWFSQLGQLNQVHQMYQYQYLRVTRSLQSRKDLREKAWEIKEWGQSVKKTGNNC